MSGASSIERMPSEGAERLVEIAQGESARLLRFIRRRVSEPADAEDVLQDVFEALLRANQALMPIDDLSAWLFRVARNRIVDLFRKKRPERLGDGAVREEDDEGLRLEDRLPSPDAGPEAILLRQALLAALESAVDELPAEQRAVFVAHELEGRSFKEIAAATGVSLNTLLSRKRYAVLHLRRRLESVHDAYLETMRNRT